MKRLWRRKALVSPGFCAGFLQVILDVPCFATCSLSTVILQMTWLQVKSQCLLLKSLILSLKFCKLLLNMYIYCFLLKQILWSNPTHFILFFFVNIYLDWRHLDYVRWSQNQLRHDFGAREFKPLSLQIFNGRDDLGDVSVAQHWRQQSKWTSEECSTTLVVVINDGIALKVMPFVSKRSGGNSWPNVQVKFTTEVLRY